MQTKCLRLMGKKLLVALTIEGKFAAEGLHDIEEDDDMLSAMARDLVEKDGIGETADQVWRRLKQVYDEALATMRPKYGHWVIFEHCLPFDISRCYDEVGGTVHPRIWTAERDIEMWKTLQAPG